MSKSTLGLSAAACTSVALLCAAPAVAGPKSPQTPSELGAEFQSQGYKVQYGRIGNCALDSGSVVGTRIGPAVWADTTTQTKAGGGVGDGAGTRGGVTWSHDIDHQIAYITVACKRPAK
ncbi:hypothetical protein D2E28_11125 [Mycobacteroides abscessus]|uniref:hypothetical protein n=1 Tax=Mycobacteroides abscessus TaxID=36809 RepID=UPI000E692464|nr:hypothetical protein [Mycobacteroides abscessus]RIR27207.1 hypothetical protein D2E28_11125 [Mycobacteroides abscessus]